MGDGPIGGGEWVHGVDWRGCLIGLWGVGTTCRGAEWQGPGGHGASGRGCGCHTM